MGHGTSFFGDVCFWAWGKVYCGDRVRGFSLGQRQRLLWVTGRDLLSLEVIVGST